MKKYDAWVTTVILFVVIIALLWVFVDNYSHMSFQAAICLGLFIIALSGGAFLLVKEEILK